ncbi:MAG: hypothetical protein QM731_29100 [Chitinophagaceae bacterium]
MNPAANIFAVAEGVLDARIAQAKGDSNAAIEAWTRAVAAEDRITYNEPPDWFYPTRESLGAALFKARRFEEADLAFREDSRAQPEQRPFALGPLAGAPRAGRRRPRHARRPTPMAGRLERRRHRPQVRRLLINVEF